MKAVILNQAGSVANLEYVQIKKPLLKTGEVLVKVASLAINPVDVKARGNEGLLSWIFEAERPATLGWDISGEVVETSSDESEFKIGDQVFGMVNFFGKGNAYAEFVAAHESHLSIKPANVTHQQAAACTMVAMTAYQALVDVAQIKNGDKVLIHGASGGVGHLAVQIAKYFGAYVVGTSSAKNKDFVLSLGADDHIDYTKEAFTEKAQDIDIVIDTIQGQTLLNSIDVTKANGIIVTLPSPEIPQEVVEKAKNKQVRVEFMMVTSKKNTIEAIAQLLEKEILMPHIHKTFSFEEIRMAHLEVETNRVVGKVIVNL